MIPTMDQSAKTLERPRGFAPDFHSESGAAAVDAASPVAALLAGRVLRDGELVLLLLRPSRWFILLSSLRFLAVVLILTTLGVIFEDRLRGGMARYIEAGVFLVAGRLSWAVLQWMSRLYILTDLRIIRLSGVFNFEIFDCSLRKVARALLDVTFKERLCQVGSIVIIPQDDECPIGVWQMVAKPKQVHENILATISRAKQGGMPCQ